MPGFNGSGTFVRTHGWVADRDASVKIRADRMDAECDGFATGLTSCVTRDGQSPATGDLPMGTNKHTGVGNATARTHYAAAGQVQDNSVCRATDSGAADAYVIGLSPAITAYAAGQRFSFVAGNTNTGASTLDVNSVDAKAIQKLGAALVAGDITAGDVVVLEYDGTQFQMVSPARTPVLKAGGIATAALADDAVTLAKMAGGTDGNLITYDASGDPAYVATGTAGQVLTSAGAGAPPTFEDIPTVAFTESFESTAQTITAGGSLTLAHGLQSQPALYTAVLVCIDAGGEHGYSQNDEVGITTQMISRGGLASRGCTLVPDATNVEVYFGSEVGTFDIINKSDGTEEIITNAKWKLIVRAWA